MFRPQGNCPNLDNFPGGGRPGRRPERQWLQGLPVPVPAVPVRLCPVPGGQVFTRANQPPGRDGGDSPRFGKNLTVPTRPRPYGNVTCPPGWRRPRPAQSGQHCPLDGPYCTRSKRPAPHLVWAGCREPGGHEATSETPSPPGQPSVSGGRVCPPQKMQWPAG